MPLVTINASAHIDNARMDKLQKEVGRLIAILPGKNIDNCMTIIRGDSDIFMSGEPSKAVYCEIHLFNASPKENKGQLTKELNQLFTEELDAEKVYINFTEHTEWGVGPDLKG